MKLLSLQCSKEIMNHVKRSFSNSCKYVNGTREKSSPIASQTKRMRNI